MKGVCAAQSRRIDGCAQICFGICSPFGAVAVGDFALDDAGPQGALADVVGGSDLAGEVAEREQLVARAPDLAKQFVRQFAVSGSAQDRIEIAQQPTSAAFHGGGGERGDVAGKVKGAIEPEFEPHPDKVAAVLFDEARLAVEVGKAGLVVQPMPLLAGIAIRYPHSGLMPGHRVTHHLGGAAELSGMNDGIARAEYPLIAVAALDPHPGLIARHNLCAAQGHERIVAPGGKDRRSALEHVHQRALADIQPEQIGKHALQPLVGK